MHVLAWIFYSFSAVVVGFGIMLVLTVGSATGGNSVLLLSYLLLLAAIPAAIGYGFDRWAQRRDG